MAEKNWCGGLCALNSGSIQESYSLVEVRSHASAGGLCGNNSGRIRDCYSFGPAGRLEGGLCAQGGEKAEASFFAVPRGAALPGTLADAALGRTHDLLAPDAFWEELGWDFETVWKPRKLRGVRLARLRPSPAAPPQDGPVREIGTAEELLALASEVNSGDAAAAAAHCRLTRDLNLGGRRITPIGANEALPFTGVFDGGGHAVTNFRVSGKKLEYAGLFGYLLGAQVRDLAVDCQIAAGKYAGGLAGVNDGGRIAGCSAAVELRCSRHCGGLVGRNTGTIERCSVTGALRKPLPPWFWAPFAGLGLLLLAVLLFLLLPRGENELESFAPVSFDPNISRIEDGEGVVMPRTDGNYVSFQFEQRIDVDLATGECVFKFKNPGDSNHNIVVQLQMIDQDLISLMGSTGRTAEEQAALAANPGYDPANYRAVVAESGAIPPGYQLGELKLTPFANGARLPPGRHNAIVYLVFYDINTNERAMLRSQLPVIIDAH